MGSPKKLRQIYDNIYGYIDFDREGFDFILKDPFFLRLHNLKQLGLAYYVYPDALHTRYAHSLGVYSNVQKIINSQKRFDDQIKIDDKDRYKIQLSALLHDIGHLPLSHTIEKALDKFDKYEKEYERQRSNDHSSSKALFKDETSENQETEKIVTLKKRPKVALHESLGELVLQNCNIGEGLRAKEIPLFDIAAGFKGDIAIAYQQEHKDDPKTFYNAQIRNFLHSQLDADRIDYLLRDASFSGVNTGSIDIDKILNSIVYDEGDNYGIESSAIRALDQFFISRYVAFCQIVGNKKVMAFEYMASDFYYRLLKLRKEQKYHLGLRLYSYRDLMKDILPNNPNEFLAFTDDYFFSLVREVMSKKEEVERQDALAASYAEMLTLGQALAPVTYIEGFEGKLETPCFIESLYNETQEETSEVLDKIAHDAKMDRSNIIIPDPMKITIYKDDEDPIGVFNGRDLMYKSVSQSPASLLWMLKDQKYCIFRIYTTDINKREGLRKTLLAYAKEQGCENLGDLE